MSTKINVIFYFVAMWIMAIFNETDYLIVSGFSALIFTLIAINESE